MAQSLASIVRAQREQRERAADTPQRAAGNALYVAQGNPRSPQAQAIAEQAGRRLGLPPMLVDEAAIEEARVRENMEALSQAHRTAAWISDPDNAAVARDQVPQLTGLEGFLASWRKETLRPFEDGLLGVRRFGAGAYEAIGGGLYGLGLTGERVLDRLGLSDPATAHAAGALGATQISGFLKEVGTRNRRAAAYLRGTEGSERALSAGVPDVLPRVERDLGFAGDVAEGLGQMGGQVLIAVGSGGFASLPSMWGQGVAQMDDRVKEAQARDGRTENSVKDDLALAGGGFVTALTEKLGLDAVMGALPAPVRARLTNKLADVVVAGVTEGASEVAEGVGQNALARTLLGEDTGLLDGDLAYQGGVGATVGAIARSLFLTAVPGRQHVADNARADRALQEGERFSAAVQAVRQNELAKRSPERFAAFLNSVTDPDAEVVIPAEAVATFFQSNPDLDVWMDEWDIRAQVEEARAAGTDVVMSQAQYLAQVAPTAAHDAWAQDIRFGLGEMSQREAEAFRTEGEASLAASMDAAIDTAQTQEEAVAPERQVRDALFSQLREAGYTADAANTQATLAARAFARRAERSPERFADAMAAYEAAGLRIEQDFPEVVRQSMDRLDVMVEALKRRSARPSDRRLFGRSMMEFLAQRGGVIDTGGELAALGVDSWHRPSQGGRAFRRRFIRAEAAGGSQYAADEAARAAVEAGYLPEGAGPNELFAAVRDELAGRPVYSQQFEADLQSQENADALDELERLMGDLGLTPDDDVQVIRERLERAAEGAQGETQGEAFNQSAPVAPPFYSALAQAVVESKTAKAPAAQWLATLKKTPGVKAEEIEWSGVEEWLAQHDVSKWTADDFGSADALEAFKAHAQQLGIVDAKGNILREALADFLEGGGVQIEETLLGGAGRYVIEVDDEIGEDGEPLGFYVSEAGVDADPVFFATREDAEGWIARNEGSDQLADGASQFSQYKLPGADDTYRELLLKLPRLGGEAFVSAERHFDDQTDVIAHARFTTRTDAEGGKVLFLEEVQSTHHETGREEGYQKAISPEAIASAEAALAAAEARRADVVARLEPLVVPAMERIIANGRVEISNLSDRLDAAISDKSAPNVEVDRLNRTLQTAESINANRERTLRAITDNTVGNRELHIETAARTLADSEEFRSGEKASLIAEWRSASLAETEARVALRTARDPSGVARAPWEKSWSQLVMKRMIRYAVDNGFDKVAWINGNQQNGGQTGGDGAWFYERNLVNDTNAILKKLGGRVERLTVGLGNNIANAEGMAAAAARSRADADALVASDERAAERLYREAEGSAEAIGRYQNNGFVLTDKIKAQAAQGFTLFQSTPYTGPRGQISFGQGRATIKLFQSRDLSTFFHEFGHLTLEMMREDAADPNASDQVKADFQTVLDWFSREAGETITADKIGVEQHELWARGNERYLMEGKAPSLELREVFRTVMAWLKNLYGTVLMLDVNLSDDVRGVMDRLLASDAEIAQARDAAGQALGSDAYRQLGASDAEVAAYERQVARARSDAESDLLAQVMRAIRRSRTREWNEAADAIRPDITAEVDAMPDMAALEFMKTTRTPMDRETVVAMLGDEAGLALLPKRVPPIVAATGGAHPDMIAEAAGYRSGQALLNGLMEMEAEKRRMVAAGDERSVRKARIEDRVREALLDRYGDPINDGSIEREALDAIHSERYGEVLALDLNLLARKTGNAPAPIDALRAWARERIGSRPVRDAKPGRYLKAERTASSAVQKALAAGDRDEAFRQKQAQTINNVLYVEAGRAERFAEAAIDRMRKLGRGRNPSIHVDYMEQIDAILEQYELKAVSGRTVQRRASLAEFIRAQEEAGEPINIPPEVIEATRKTNLADLTVDELRGLDAAIKNLVHLGRLKTTLILNGERRELDRLADQAWATAQALPDVRADEAPGDKSAWENITGWGARLEASLVKAQEYFRLLDGGDRLGVFHEALDRPGQAAADRRVALQDAFWNPVLEAKKAVPAKVQAAWLDVVEDHPFINPNTGQPIRSLKRRDLLGAALHVGTASNFEKMAKGYGLISKEADAMAVSAARQGFIGWLNERLDASEWAYVQAIWDAHERLRPDYFAAARRIEGFEPEAVEAEVVNTPAGPLRGGYAPIAYHPSYDQAAQVREQRDAASMFGDVMSAGPRPDNGSTNARTTYVGPVKLGLDDARYQAERHITYAAYAEYITNSLKFLRHPLIASTIKRKLGLAAYNTFEPWLASQVRDETVIDPGANPILQLAKGVRTNMTAAVLMGSATVLIAQPGGLAQSSVHLGPKWLAKGVAHAVGLNATGNLKAFITERSEFMRLRVEQGDLDRDYRLAMQQARGAEGLRAQALTLTGKAIALVDFYGVSSATWMGAYDKALSEGRDESQAVYEADMAVRVTQGGGRAIDQAGIQRANEVTKMMTFAYGWANALYNMQRAAVVDLKNGHDRFENAVRLTSLLVLPALLDAALSGDWPERGETVEETMRNMAAWFARNVFFGAAAGVPLLRDLAGTGERLAAGEFAGPIGQTPYGRLGDSAFRLANDAWTAAFEPDKDVSRRWPAHLIQATGLALGLPGTTQAARAVNYVTDVQDGEQQPDGVLDWMNGLLRGPQKDQER